MGEPMLKRVYKRLFIKKFNLERKGIKTDLLCDPKTKTVYTNKLIRYRPNGKVCKLIGGKIVEID